MTLEQYIGQLLYDRDCVIVPGFGAFVTRSFPAEMNPATHIFIPPSRRLSFQPGLRADDGFLNEVIALNGHYSQDVVRLQISDIVTGWHRRLHKGERVRLEGLGVFYIDREGELQFKPQIDLNFDSATFGLGVFRVSPLLAVEETEEPRVIPLHKRPERRRVPVWRNVAAAAGVAGLLFIGGVKSNIDFQGYLAGFEPEKWIESVFDSEETRNDAPVEVKETSPSELIKPTETPEKVAVEAAIPEVEVTLQPAAVSALVPGKYYVIVGSFVEEANAENLFRELKSGGHNPILLPNDGRFNKVAVAAYDDRQKALQGLRKYKSQVQRSAWIYRK